MKKNYKIILLFCLLLGGMLSDASAKRKNSFVRKDEIIFLLFEVCFRGLGHLVEETERLYGFDEERDVGVRQERPLFFILSADR